MHSPVAYFRIPVCILSFTMIFSSGLFAQKKDKINKRFGKINAQHLIETPPMPDSDASAVILYERMGVKFNLNQSKGLWQLIHTVHRRVKILTNSGLDQADVEVPYYAWQNIDDVSGVKGLTHNLVNGKAESQKMTRDAIFDDDLDGRTRIKKFSLPNASVGSIIEYEYSYITTSVHNMETWYFQHEIPTLYSELSTAIPEYFTYRPMFRGEPVALEQESNNFTEDFFKGIKTNYVAHDVPALVEEKYTTTMRNFISRIDFQLTNYQVPGAVYKDFNRTWDQMNNQILDAYKDYLSAGGAVKGDLQSMSEPSIVGINNYVRGKYRWSGRHGIYPSKEIRKLTKEKDGNGAALNLLLATMLKEAGFDAYPVLISTRRHGATQSFYPMLRQFNHCIVFVKLEEGGMLMDATDPFCPGGMLPYQDLNGQGMIISKRGPDWINLASPVTSDHSWQANLKMEPNGELIGDLKLTESGYMSLSSRKDYFKKDEDAFEYAKEEYFSELTGFELEEAEIENFDTIGKPLKLHCKVRMSDYVNVAGDYIYLQPMLMAGMEENPFQLEKRTYPVDFAYPFKDQFRMILFIPEGYEVDESPQPVRMVLPDKSGSFTYQVMAMGNQVQILSTIKIDKELYSAEEYLAVKQLFELIRQKHGEQVVLKRKS